MQKQKLHKGQKHIIENARRFNVVVCGRRFGKTVLAINIMQTGATLKNFRMSYYAPTNKNFKETWTEIKKRTKPLIQKVNESYHQIIFKTGAILDFWSMDNYEPIRGNKYHLAIIDEAAATRSLKKAWLAVIRATLADYRGTAWLFSTPQPNDFKEFAEYELKNSNWKTFYAPTSANPHIHPDEIADMKRDLPELIFRQEVLGEFVNIEGAILRQDWIKTTEMIPYMGVKYYIGVDLAISQKNNADYSVICTIAKDNIGNVYVVDVDRGRWTYNETKERIKTKAAQYNPEKIGIEAVAYQSVMIQELARETSLPVFKLVPDGDKIKRFTPLWSKFENSKVFIHKNVPEYFISELMEFPIGKHDDCVDAFSYANIISEKKRIQVF